MTTPEQRTKAILDAGELLREARKFDLPEKVRNSILYTLRHHPEWSDIEHHAHMLSNGRTDIPLDAWILPDKNTFKRGK